MCFGPVAKLWKMVKESSANKLHCQEPPENVIPHQKSANFSNSATTERKEGNHHLDAIYYSMLDTSAL
jgi:hypothetical protein